MSTLAHRLTELAKLDLGNKPPEYSQTAGCYPVPPKVWFPSIYVDNASDDLDDFPDEGKAVVNYKIIRRSTEKFDGKTRKGATIEIQNISTKLKELASKADEILLADPRPRDGMGQFEGAQAQGVDPLAMKAAYEHIRRQQAQEKAQRNRAVKQTLTTGGIGVLAGLAGHKIGKLQGVAEGVEQGGRSMLKKWAAGQKKAVSNVTRQKAGLGEMLAKAQRTIGVQKEVESDNLAEIRRLRKGSR